jgi:hypothetical protein
MTPNTLKRRSAVLVALALSLGLAACGNTVSTSGYKGESHAVAQTISNLESDATTGSQSKLCKNDLASSVVKRLASAAGECQKALKDQISQIDNFDLEVVSIAVKGTTATARVRSRYYGKGRITTMQLVKEGKSWKVSGLT